MNIPFEYDCDILHFVEFYLVSSEYGLNMHLAYSCLRISTLFVLKLCFAVKWAKY